MTAHIRKRKYKSGIRYQVVLEVGIDSNGKRKREYISCDSYAEAQAIKAEKLHQYNMGSFIEASKITVQNICEQWFKLHVEQELAITTQNGYRVNLENHVYPAIGNIKVQKLTPVQLQMFYDDLKKKGLSPRSIRYIHTTLHTALKFAMRMGVVGRNVTEFVSPPKGEKFKPDIYNEAEVLELLNCCKDTQFEVPITLAVGMGMRKGEVFGLQWKDIDFSDNTLHVCHNLTCVKGKKIIGKPKTESSDRKILMPDYVVTMLKKHKIEQAKNRLKLGRAYQDNDLVYCYDDGTPRSTNGFSGRFSEFLEKNGLRHIRFHDLRHINATLMLQYGVPAKIASERLGHSTIQTTMNIYSHVTVEMQKDTVNIFDNNIFSKVAEG